MWVLQARGDPPGAGMSIQECRALAGSCCTSVSVEIKAAGCSLYGSNEGEKKKKKAL